MAMGSSMSDEFLEGFCRYLAKIKTISHTVVVAALFAAFCSLLSLIGTHLVFTYVDAPILPFIKMLSYGLPFLLVFCSSFILIRSFTVLHIRNVQLWEIAEQDDLTKLVNRAGFLRQGRALAHRADENVSSLSMIMFDVDHFKLINDTQGHLAGDMALKHLSGILHQTCREFDVVARWGGEEFAIILPFANAQGAAILAERLRERIAKSPFYWEKKEFHLTISAGVTEWLHEGDCLDDMVQRADTALYQAKAAGRNRVQLLRTIVKAVECTDQDLTFADNGNQKGAAA